MGAYNRRGEYVRFPAWQDDPPDEDYGLVEEDFEPPVPDPDFEAWLDDHDRRFDDYYSTQNGDIGDESDPPY